MANARKCDKCGVLYEIYEQLPDDFTVCQLNERFVWNSLDLCPSCQVDLTLWMQGKAEFVLKEVTDNGTDGK